MNAATPAPPRVFCRKSLEFAENKGVRFFPVYQESATYRKYEPYLSLMGPVGPRRGWLVLAPREDRKSALRDPTAV